VINYCSVPQVLGKNVNATALPVKRVKNSMNANRKNLFRIEQFKHTYSADSFNRSTNIHTAVSVSG